MTAIYLRIPVGKFVIKSEELIACTRALSDATLGSVLPVTMKEL